MGSESLQDLTPDTRAAAERLIGWAAENGLVVKVVSTLRTCAEQNALFAQGRTAPGDVVTHAPGCRSWHVFGRAMDVMLRNSDGSLQLEADPRYEVLGDMGRELGFVWGGAWGDPGHFEYHPGLEIEVLCPDSDDCQMAVARYGSGGNYYVPDDLVKRSAQEASGINLGDVLFSAVIGAVVFQAVAYGVRRVTKGK